MVEIDVRVQGGWYQGEEEMLGALRAIGLEKYNTVLKDGGFRTVKDLLPAIDAAQLSFRCPGLDDAQIPSILERLAEGRQGGFMSKEAQLLASRIEAWVGTRHYR